MLLQESVVQLFSNMSETIVDIVTLKVLMIISIILLLIYFILKPINRVRGIYEVGWLSKSDRRRRKVGDLPPVFPNGWFAVAESSNLHKNQVIHVACLGQNLAVFRSSSGEVKVLDAYCPHLGANMAVGGKVHGDCLQCPFHLWSFHGDTGACTTAPPLEKVPKNAKVKKWVSHECNDFIFVWYHAEGELPGWYPPDIKDLKELTFHGRNQYQVNCHIQEIPENGSDFTHFLALHEANVFTGGDLRHHETKWFQIYRHCWSASWEAGTTPGEQHIGKGTLLHKIKLFGKINIVECDIDIRQTVTPTEPLVQAVIHRVYSSSYLNLPAKFLLYNESIMFERDMMIWNNKRFVERPLLSKEDACIGKYRKWFSQFYSEHSPTYETVLQESALFDW